MSMLVASCGNMTTTRKVRFLLRQNSSRKRWSGRPLDYFTAQYAKCVVALYNIKEHPSFDEYARGVLWEHDNDPESALPFTSEQLAEEMVGEAARLLHRAICEMRGSSIQHKRASIL